MKISLFAILLPLVLFSGGSISMSQVKKPQRLPTPPKFSDAKQMILVITPDWNSIQGKLQRYERKKAKGKWQKVGDEMPIVVGRTGLAWGEGLHDISIIQAEQPIKREGDGKSPAGIFSLTSAFGTAADASNLKLPYTPLIESTECVDDVKSGKYNTIVDRYKVGNFDRKSSEKMLAVGEEYSLGVFVAHNSNPPQKGRGSCIFLHVWKDDSSATSGCTAMQKENMQEILRWLDAKQTPVLVQLPAGEFERLRDKWKLPKNN
jgi:L,D-peptidoglycan transpeptidase YkuD (ErfK/YbiS/YcfS/YnhG family)